MSNTKLPDIPIDYLTRDYNGYFELMKDAIPILAPEWTDTSDSDQGIVILQLLSYGLHLISYYQERSLQESILELARTKRGILMGCNFLGYETPRQQASYTYLTVVKDSDFLNVDCKVNIKDKFSTDPQLGEPIIFEAMEEVIIPAGQLIGKVFVKQGITYADEILGVGKGEANEEFTIPNADVLLESLKIYTYEANAVRFWSITDNFLNSTQNDRHYTVGLDEEDRTVIKFGTGLFGMKPPKDSTIYVTYRTGGGKKGDLAPNLISNVYETDSDLNFVAEVYNEEFSIGGADYEDLEVSKTKAPRHYRTGGKAVTPTDFKDLSEMFDGVARVKVVETFTIDLLIYVLSELYEPATEALCAELKDYLDANRVNNVRIQTLPCTIVDFDVKLTIYVHEGYNVDDVLNRVEQAIRKYYDITTFDFGGEFYASKIINLALNTAGVKNIVLDPTTVDIQVDENEILRLKNINILVGGEAQ